VHPDGACRPPCDAFDGEEFGPFGLHREHVAGLTARPCGFCTPGMVMSAIDLVKDFPNPTEEQIREQLDGNLCRCTGYHNIVKAIKAASQTMRS